MGSELTLVMHPPALNGLVDLLHAHGYSVIGPTLEGSVVVLDELSSFDERLLGVGSVSAPGEYRVEESPGAIFGGPVGPVSPKRWLSPPHRVAWSARVEDGSLQVTPEEQPGPRAYLGIRPCDVAAKSILATTWQGHPDDLVVVVECTAAGETCFCTSMGTGPSAPEGADVILTELGDGRVLVRSGSDRGSVLLARVDGDIADREDADLGRERVRAAAAGMRRQVDPDAAHRALTLAPESPVWESVARRCLGCANCTMVCPTCFCSSINDTADLDGEVRRTIRWDSCFNPGFSEVHGGVHRASVSARYRHWATHKFSAWWEQFGSAGCVGCGRCITWCPVGIDITEEVNLIIKEVDRA